MYIYNNFEEEPPKNHGIQAIIHLDHAILRGIALIGMGLNLHSITSERWGHMVHVIWVRVLLEHA